MGTNVADRFVVSLHIIVLSSYVLSGVSPFSIWREHGDIGEYDQFGTRNIN